jgi:hypothetical protein
VISAVGGDTEAGGDGGGAGKVGGSAWILDSGNRANMGAWDKR